VALPDTENEAGLSEPSFFTSSAPAADEQAPSMPDREQSPGLTTPSALSSMKSEDMTLSEFDHAPDEPLAEAVENGENRTLEELGKETADDLELPELADELDKIFGTDGTDDESFSEGDIETIEETTQNRYTKEIETLDLSELDDELDQLLDSEHLAKKEIADEEPRTGGYGDTEILDLSDLGDDFDSVPEIDTPGKDAIETDTDSEFIEEISLDELDDELDEMADKNKEPITEVEAETGLDLKKEPLPTEGDDIMDDLFKSESLALHDQIDDLDEDISSTEEATGLDTIQIQDFESDLDDLEEIKPEKRDTADVSEIEKDSSIDTKEIESAGQVLDEQDSQQFESLDVVPENLGGPEPGTDDSSPKTVSKQDEDFNLDTREIESFDMEPENLDELTSTADETQPKEASEQDEDFSLDTRQIESFDLELENLDELTSTADETQPKEVPEQDEDFSLDTRQIESFDLELENLDELTSTADETQPKEVPEQDEDFSLDTRQIESFDLELENLDELELTGDEVRPKEVSEQDEPFTLDTNQIESLDLELENLDELELPADETRPKEVSEQDGHFILDTNQIKSLDLDLENPDDYSLSDADQDKNIILDTDQIKSLNLELKSTDKLETPESIAHDKKSKESSMLSNDITLDTDREKTAEVLNLNLERPDLDGTFDLEDGIDLPILDELLAPAEVTDETLIDSSFDLQDDFKSDLKDDYKFDLDEKLMEDLEEAAPDDSQPILELEAIDKKADITEKDIENKEVQAATQAEATVTPDTEREILKETKVATEPTDHAIAAGKTAGSGRFETLPRQRTGKWLMVPLIIVLLLALLFGINAMGVKIPFLSNLNIPFLSGSGQMANNPGSARIKTVDIDGKFITNKKSGRLFVITGEVLNQYDNTRGFIQIKGNIYAGGGKLVETKSVHCGNFLSDTDLAAKPFADIQRYLTDKLGAGGAGTLKVGPRKTLPFMIVFAGLPADIEEFSVEVIGSAAL
jgi:hypothetical protein